MNEWHSNMSGFLSDESFGYDQSNTMPSDASQYYGNYPQTDFASVALAPPTKAARPDLEQNGFGSAGGSGMHAFAESRTAFHSTSNPDSVTADDYSSYPQTSPALVGTGFPQSSSQHPYPLREEWHGIPDCVTYDQTKPDSYPNTLMSLDVDQTSRASRQDMTHPPPVGHFSHFGSEDFNAIADLNSEAISFNLRHLPYHRKRDFSSPYARRSGSYRDFSGQRAKGERPVRSHSIRAPHENAAEWRRRSFASPNDFGRKRCGSPPACSYARVDRFPGPGHLDSRACPRRPQPMSGLPRNRILQPQWMGMSDSPLNAIHAGPTNCFGRGRSFEPVSLLEATFAPPAGLPMLAKRERSVARWAKAVRREWPSHERQCGTGMQFTSFLSDVLQRELRKNMTFVYGALRDVALSDRGARGEFYPRDARETSVLVDLYYDDVFVAHGCGSERFDARERASENALHLFLRDRVFVVGCYRLWEGELIPGFCASNSRQPPQRLPPFPRNPKRDRTSSGKPDSKTLPWLQVNPSSKLDTSDRLKPKSMKDFFILVNGRGDDYAESEEKSYDFGAGFPRSLNPVAVMNNSAQFNQMKVEYRAGSTPSGGHRCTIVLDQQTVGEAEGWDANQARRAACESVLSELSSTQPVVRMQLDKAQVVTRRQLDGHAERLASEAPGWVTVMDAKLEPANPMKEPHLQKVMDDAEAFLKQYIRDERQEPLKFGSEFTHDERMAIHKAARRLGLASKPYGPQWRLYQVVSLRFSLDALKRILLAKGVAGRYALVSPGSGDFSHLLTQEEEETSVDKALSGAAEEEEKDGADPDESSLPVGQD